MEISLQDIWIDRESRQRKEIDVSDLLESIPRRGVLVPIIVVDEVGPDGQPYKLLAGERRFTACTKLGLSEIPASLLNDLPLVDQQVIELEENLRRKDLTWQEQCEAIFKLHETLSAQGEWSFTKTAEHLGFSPSWVQQCCRIAKEFHRDNVRAFESFTRAQNFLAREDERMAADAISSILSSATEAVEAHDKASPIEDLLNPSPDAVEKPTTRLPAVLSSEKSILHTSFLDWAPQYQGEPFNLIHCDFPYGVNVFGGKWSGKAAWSQYKDTADIYEKLIVCLCENLDRLMAHSAHLVFWLSADIKIQARTLALFAEFAPQLSFSNFPLVWLKSDNVGIVPDPKREPRRIVETALIASREDRLLVRPVSNAIAAQTNKEHHPHTKPEPVLKHFLQMFVDKNTRMLDPTCGGGSSLRAAESLGAAHVLGLEINDEYVANARKALNHFRVLHKASSLQKEQKGE